MTNSAVTAPAPRNRLLRALPSEDLAILWPQLEPIELIMRHTLQMPGIPMASAYFIETGWISMIATFEDGDGAEVGLVGHEGILGLPLLLSDDSDDLEGMVQGPGTALCLSASAFHEALERLPNFRHLLNRYALVHHGQVARTAACNSRHDIAHRLARWLLMGHDRAEGNTYSITHEFLAMMLGVRRGGISVAASTLQKAGLIQYRHGQVTITDRDGLENASCECYGVTRHANERLFGPDGSHTPDRR